MYLLAKTLGHLNEPKVIEVKMLACTVLQRPIIPMDKNTNVNHHSSQSESFPMWPSDNTRNIVSVSVSVIVGLWVDSGSDVASDNPKIADRT